MRIKKVFILFIIGLLATASGFADNPEGGDYKTFKKVTKVSSPSNTWLAFALAVSKSRSPETGHPTLKNIVISIIQPVDHCSYDFKKLNNAVKNELLGEINLKLVNGETLSLPVKFERMDHGGNSLIMFIALPNYLHVEPGKRIDRSQATQFILKQLASSDIKSITYDGITISMSGSNSSNLVSQVVKEAHTDAGTNYLAFDEVKNKEARDRFVSILEKNLAGARERRAKEQLTKEKAKTQSQNSSYSKSSNNNKGISNNKGTYSNKNTETPKKIKIEGTYHNITLPKASHLVNAREYEKRLGGCQALAINSENGIVVSPDGLSVIAEKQSQATDSLLLKALYFSGSLKHKINDMFLTPKGYYGIAFNNNDIRTSGPRSMELNITHNIKSKELISITANDRNQWVTVWRDHSGRNLYYTDGSDVGLTKALQTAEKSLGDITGCYINEEGQAAICCRDGVYLYNAPSNLYECLKKLDFIPTNVQFTPSGLYFIFNRHTGKKAHFL